MDAAGLAILLKELERDCLVAADSADKAVARSTENTPGHLEACAYELARFYGTVERMLERISEEVENHFEKRGDYHERLLQRLSLDLEGIRPAFFPQERLDDLRELKGFRHLVRHAYDVKLRGERLAELANLARSLAAEMTNWRVDFEKKMRTEQGW